MITDPKDIKTVVRFAPSPTGNLHIGGVRTALFNFLFARKYGGKFILRIEDTDKERSKKEYEEGIIDALSYVGLPYDEIYRQSERTEIYKKYTKQLVEDGYAYISKETPREAGERDEVIRFKNPNKNIIFQDIILGEINVNTADLGDFVIAKDFETPIFHLTNVIDDHEMGVTHVIRAQEHLANTPRQILIHEAIGASIPEYAHIPLILASDRSKLSKRHGAVAVAEYKNQGYLSEAVINYLALLGWNPGTEQEIFSIEELIGEFRLEKVQKSGAIFNTEKLDWFNKQYIMKLSEDVLLQKMFAALSEEILAEVWFKKDIFEKIIPIIQEKIVRFGEVPVVVNETRFFFEPLDVFTNMLIPPVKGERDITPENITKTKQRLCIVIDMLQKIPEGEFTAENVKTALWDYATAEGRGNVLWPMRYALTGSEKSPDPFTVASVLGKSETISRLNNAVSNSINI